MLFLVLLLFSLCFSFSFACIPDATSSLSCTSSSVIVGAQLNCVIQVRNGGNACAATCIDFTFEVTPENNGLTGFCAVVGNTITFRYQASVLGLATLTDGVSLNSFAIYGVSIPDATTTMTCDPSFIASTSGVATCTITPKKVGTTVFATQASFTLSDGNNGGFSWVAIADAAPAATLLQFTYTAATASTVVTISNGYSTTTETLYTSPDSSSSISCSMTTIAILGSTLCTIIPRKTSSTVYALASSFTLSSGGGASGIVTPTVGNSLSFTYSAASTSGVYSISDSVSATSFSIAITDIPDSTSTFICPGASVPSLLLGAALSCTTSPKKSSTSILALSSSFSFNGAGGGTFNSPSFYGTSFSLTFTSTTSGQYVIGDGVSSTTKTVRIRANFDSSSIVSCDKYFVSVDSDLSCYISTKVAGSSVYTFNSFIVGSVNVSDGSSWFGFISPTFGTSFSFVLHSGLISGLYSVSIAPAPSIVLTVVDYPDSTSTFTCSSNVITSGSSIYCTSIAKKSSVPIIAYNSSFSYSFSPTSPFAFFSFTSAYLDSIPLTASSAISAQAILSEMYSNANFGVSSVFYTRFYTLSVSSGVFVLTDGVSASDVTITICAIPDSTTSLTALSYVISVSSSTILTIIPKVTASTIFSYSSSFTMRSTFFESLFPSTCLSCISNSFTTLSPNNCSNLFIVTLNSGTESGNFTIADGFSSGVSVIVYDTPDSTSAFSCTLSTMAIGETMTCTTLPKKSNRRIYSQAASFSFIGGGGTFTSIAGTDGIFRTTYTATFSGMFSLSDSVSSSTFPIFVTDNPDSTSRVICDESSISILGLMSCAFIPRKLSTLVYSNINAYASRFVASVASPSSSSLLFGSLSALSAVGQSYTSSDLTIASQFNFTFSTFSVSEYIQIADGLGSAPFAFYIVGIPDSTSLITCVSTHVPVSTSLSCSFFPKSLQVSIYAYARSISVSAAPSISGNISELFPSTLSKTFSFSFSASAISRIVVLSSIFGGSEFNIYVTSSPDATSIFSCNSTVVSVGEGINCTSILRKNSVLVYNAFSFVNYVLNPSNTVLALANTMPDSSAIATIFSSSFAAIISSPIFTQIRDSVSADLVTVLIYDVPDSSSFISCENSFIQVGANLGCYFWCQRISSAINCLENSYTPLLSVPAATLSSPVVSSANFSILNSFFVAAKYYFNFTAISSNLYSLNSHIISAPFYITAYDIPDSSSFINCTRQSSSVFSTLECNIYSYLNFVSIFSLSSYFNARNVTCLSGCSNTASISTALNPNSIPARSFVVNFQCGSVSDKYRLFTGISSSETYDVIVSDIPDSTSTIACSTYYPNVNSVFNCTLNPRKAGISIYTFSSAFSLNFLSVDGHPITGLSFVYLTSIILPASSFSVQVTTGVISGVYNLSDSVSESPFLFTVLAVPDSTSFLSCESSNMISVLSNMSCFVVPKSTNVNIYSLASYFSPSLISSDANTAFIGSLYPALFSGNFSFIFSAGNISTTVGLTDSISPAVTVTIYAFPDGTSILNCSSTFLFISSSLFCSITPKRNSIIIFALARSLSSLTINNSISSSWGSISGLIPSVIGVEFSFNFLSNVHSGIISIETPVSVRFLVTIVRNPDSSSILSCAFTTLPVMSSIFCTFIPRYLASEIYVLPSVLSFNVSTYYGEISIFNIPTISPLNTVNPASYFTFVLTSNSFSSLFIMSEKLTGNSFVFSVWDVPDFNSIMSCNSFFVYVSQTLDCNTTSFNSASIPRSIYSFASNFSAVSSAGTFSSFNPLFAPSTYFNYVFTAGLVSMETTLSDSISPFRRVVVLDIPDKSSNISCSINFFYSNQVIYCQIFPKKLGISIYSLSKLLSLSSVPAVSGLLPEYGNFYNFSLSSFNAASGNYTLTDGNSEIPYRFYILDIPDQTSVILCTNSFVNVSSTLNCTFEPRKNGAPIFMLLSSVNLQWGVSKPDKDDYTSYISTSYTNQWPLHQQFTQNERSQLPTSFVYFTLFSGNVSELVSVLEVVSGVSIDISFLIEPDSSSSISCNSNAILVNSFTTCHIIPRVRNIIVYTNYYMYFIPIIIKNFNGDTGGSVTLVSNQVSNNFEVRIQSFFLNGPFNITANVISPYNFFIADIPDGTSLIYCDKDFLPAYSSMYCYLTPRKEGVSIMAFNYSNVLTLTENFPPVSGANAYGGSWGIIYPYIAFNFTFNFTCGASDSWSFSDGHSFLNFYFRVYDVPDSTSLFSCTASKVSISSSLLCHIYARKNSVNIYSLGSAFNLSALNVDTSNISVGNFSSLDTVATIFSVYYHSSTDSSTYSLTNGLTISRVLITVYGVPDSTSSIVCVQPTMPIRSTLNCSIIARNSGVSIFAVSSSFSLSIVPFSDGSFDAITPIVSRSLSFIFHSGFISDSFQLTDGVSSNLVGLIVTGTPDGTDLITCNTTMIFGGESASCILVPKINNVQIYAFGTDFSMSVIPRYNGNFSQVIPSGVSNSFNTTYTANYISQPLLLADGFSATQFPLTILWYPDNSSVVSCSNSLVYVNGVLSCSIQPKSKSVSIYTLSDLFTISVTQYLDSNLTSNLLSFSVINVTSAVVHSNISFSSYGWFSSFDKYMSNHLLFSFLLPTIAGAYSLTTNKDTDPFILIVYDISDTTSAISCDSGFMLINAVIKCNILSRKSGNRFFSSSSQYLLSTNGSGTSLIGRFTTITPSVAQEFVFEFLSFSTLGPFKIFDQNSNIFADIFIVDHADATSTHYCSVTNIYVNTFASCKLIPKRLFENIPVLQSDFVMSVANFLRNNVSSLVPSNYGAVFDFIFTAGSLSEIDYIYNGLSNFGYQMTITDYPDNTSSISCPAFLIGSRQSMTCSIYPRRNGLSIYTFANLFFVNLSSHDAGIISILKPSFPTPSNHFSFTFKAGIVIGVFNIYDNTSAVPYAVNVTVDQSCIIVAGLESDKSVCNSLRNLAIPNLVNECSSNLTLMESYCKFDNFSSVILNPVIFSLKSNTSILTSSCIIGNCSELYMNSYSSCILNLGSLEFSIIKPSPYNMLPYVNYYTSCAGTENSVPTIPSFVLSNGMSCSAMFSLVSSVCGFTLENSYEILFPPFCSKDCSIVWSTSEFFGKCIATSFLPFVSLNQKNEIVDFHTSCILWKNCTSFDAPISLYDSACNGITTCRTVRDYEVSSLCPPVGLVSIPESLISDPVIWPTSNFLSLVPDVCTPACAVAFLSFYSDCLNTELPTLNISFWVKALEFKNICSFPRNFPAGNNCTLRESLVAFVCQFSYQGRNFNPPNPTYCSYECSDVYLPFYSDCFQYDVEIPLVIKSYNNTCYNFRRRPPAPPSGFTATVFSYQSIGLVWQLPVALGTPIVEFLLEYSILPDLPPSSACFSISTADFVNCILTLNSSYFNFNSVFVGTNLSYVFSDLNSNSTYLFRIAASTSLGNSFYSKAIVCKTLKSAPSAPQYVTVWNVSSSTVSVSFARPLSDLSSFVNLSYRIDLTYTTMPNMVGSNAYTPGTSKLWNPHLDTNSLNCTLEGIIPGSSGFLRVTAKYPESGYGKFSTYVQFNLYSVKSVDPPSFDSLIFNPPENASNNLLSFCVIKYLPSFSKYSVASNPYMESLFEIEISVLPESLWSSFSASMSSYLLFKYDVSSDSPFYLRIPPFELISFDLLNSEISGILNNFQLNVNNSVYTIKFNSTSLDFNLSVLSPLVSCSNISCELDSFRSISAYIRIKSFVSSSSSWSSYSNALLIPGFSISRKLRVSPLNIGVNEARFYVSSPDLGNLNVDFFKVKINCSSCLSPYLSLSKNLSSLQNEWIFQTSSYTLNFFGLTSNTSYLLVVSAHNPLGWSDEVLYHFDTFADSPEINSVYIQNYSSMCSLNETFSIVVQFSSSVRVQVLNSTNSFPLIVSTEIMDSLFIFSPSLNSFATSYSFSWIDSKNVLIVIIPNLAFRSINDSIKFWPLPGRLYVGVDSLTSINLGFTNSDGASFPLLSTLSSKSIVFGDCNNDAAVITFGNIQNSLLLPVYNAGKVRNNLYLSSNSSKIGVKLTFNDISISNLCNQNPLFNYCILQCFTSGSFNSSSISFVSFGDSINSIATPLLYVSASSIFINISVDVVNFIESGNQPIFTFQYQSSLDVADVFSCQILTITSVWNSGNVSSNDIPFVLDSLTYLTSVYAFSSIGIFFSLNFTYEGPKIVENSTSLFSLNRFFTTNVSFYKFFAPVGKFISLPLYPDDDTRNGRVRVSITANAPAYIFAINLPQLYDLDSSISNFVNISCNFYFSAWATANQMSICSTSLINSYTVNDSIRLNRFDIEGPIDSIRTAWKYLRIYLEYDNDLFFIQNVSLNEYRHFRNFNNSIGYSYGFVSIDLYKIDISAPTFYYKSISVGLQISPFCDIMEESPRIISSRFIEHGSGLLVSFDRPVSVNLESKLQLFTAKSMFSKSCPGECSTILRNYSFGSLSSNCRLYFNSSIVSLFGIDVLFLLSNLSGLSPRCILEKSSLKVYFGNNALLPYHVSIAGSLVIYFVNNSPIRICPFCLSGFSGSFNLTSPVNFALFRPSANLIGFKMVGQCNEINIHATNITGLGGLPPLFHWFFSHENLLPISMSASSLSSSSSLILSTLLLPNNADYNVSLFISNPLWNVSSELLLFTFQKSIQPIPQVVISGVSPIQLSFSSLNSLINFEATVSASVCVPLDNQRLVYLWKLSLLPPKDYISDPCLLVFKVGNDFATSYLKVSLLDFFDSIVSTECSNEILALYLPTKINYPWSRNNSELLHVESLRALVSVTVGYQIAPHLKSTASSVFTFNYSNIVPVIFPTSDPVAIPLVSLYFYPNETVNSTSDSSKFPHGSTTQSFDESQELFLDGSASFLPDLISNLLSAHSFCFELKNNSSFNQFNASDKLLLLIPAARSVISSLKTACWSYKWSCKYYSSTYSSGPCLNQNTLEILKMEDFMAPINSFDINTENYSSIIIDRFNFLISIGSVLCFPKFTFRPGRYEFVLTAFNGFSRSSSTLSIFIVSSNQFITKFHSGLILQQVFRNFSVPTFSTYLSNKNVRIETIVQVTTNSLVEFGAITFIPCSFIGAFYLSWAFTPTLFNTSIWLTPSLNETTLIFNSGYFNSSAALIDDYGSNLSSWSVIASTKSIELSEIFTTKICRIETNIKLRLFHFEDALSCYNTLNATVSLFLNESVTNSICIISTSQISVSLIHSPLFGGITIFPSVGLEYSTPFFIRASTIEFEMQNVYLSNYPVFYQFFLLSNSTPNIQWTGFSGAKYEYSLYNQVIGTSLPMFPISGDSSYLRVSPGYRIPISPVSTFPFIKVILPSGLLSIDVCATNFLGVSKCYRASVLVVDNFNSSVLSSTVNLVSEFCPVILPMLSEYAISDASKNDDMYSILSSKTFPAIFAPYNPVSYLNDSVIQNLSNLFGSRMDGTGIFSLSDMIKSLSSYVPYNVVNFYNSLQDSFTFSEPNYYLKSTNLVYLVDDLVKRWNLTKSADILNQVPTLIFALNSKSGSILAPFGNGSSIDAPSNLIETLFIRKRIFSALSAISTSSPPYPIDVKAVLSSLNMLLSPSFNIDSHLIKNSVSLLSYLICSSSVVSYVANDFACSTNFDNAYLLSSNFFSVLSFDMTLGALSSIFTTVINIIDRSFLANTAQPFVYESISEASELPINLTFPTMTKISLNNSVLMRNSRKFSKLYNKELLAFKNVIALKQVHTACFPPLSLSIPPNLPNTESISQYFVRYQLFSLLPFIVKSVIKGTSFLNSPLMFLSEECSAGSISCFVQMLTFDQPYRRNIESKVYDGPSSRVPPVLVTWPLTKSTATIVIPANTINNLRAISLGSKLASTLMSAFVNSVVSTRNTLKLNDRVSAIISDSFATAFTDADLSNIFMYYTPATYFPNSSAAYTSVLTYSLQVPFFISHPIVGTVSDVTDPLSPYSPIYMTALNASVIKVTFTLNPLDCLEPDCYLTCFSLPTPSTFISANYDLSSTRVSSESSWILSDISNGVTWKQISTNTTIVQNGLCDYTATVTCSIPIFPFISENKNTTLDQLFLPRLSASVVVLKTTYSPNSIPSVSPSSPVDTSDDNLALILGLTIPFGFIFLLVLLFILYRYFNPNTEKVSDDSVDIFDKSPKEKVEIASDTGNIEMFQKRKVKKNDIEIRDQLLTKKEETSEVSIIHDSKGELIEAAPMRAIELKNMNFSESLVDIPGIVSPISLKPKDTRKVDSELAINEKLITVTLDRSGVAPTFEPVVNILANQQPTEVRSGVNQTATSRFANKLFAKIIKTEVELPVASLSEELNVQLITKHSELVESDSDNELPVIQTKEKVTKMKAPDELRSSMFIDVDDLKNNN